MTGRVARAGFLATIPNPSTPGALCAGRWALFDLDGPTGETGAQRAERHARAAALCRWCPHLARCRSTDWAPGAGVLGGYLHREATQVRPIVDLLLDHDREDIAS